MLKMLLDPMGGIVMTNDGNCILREVDVSHPAAKSMIELSRAQDEEVGDGTTSVIVLSGEILSLALPMIERNFHPTVIVSGYSKALAKALDTLDVIARRGKTYIKVHKQVLTSFCASVDINNTDELRQLVMSAIGTKFSSRWGAMMVDLAITAVLKIVQTRGEYKEVDVKRYVRYIRNNYVILRSVHKGCDNKQV